VASGLRQLREKPPDLVLLDLGLPDGTGHDVLLWIRRQSDLPVIILTAEAHLNTKVELLNLGADDYLVKPFELDELLVRISVRLRRFTGDVVRFGALTVSVTQRQVSYAGKEALLSPMEFQIVRVLMAEPGRLYSKQEISAELWGGDLPLNRNLLSVHMVNLRTKLQKVGGAGLIRTVRGSGYAMRVQGDQDLAVDQH